MPGLMILQPRAWGELATVQPTGWVPQWTVNVIPPYLLITVCALLGHTLQKGSGQ